MTKRNETAYAKMTRAEKRRKKQLDRHNARNICGAMRRNGQVCKLTPGYGTSHRGIGACKYHGGSTRNHNAHAAKERAVLMGAPIDINPLDALIWCIKITAGEIEFCTKQLEILEQEEWIENTIVGKQLHLWAKERQKAVERLAKFAKDALALGIAERAVRLAEQYGTSIAKYTEGLLRDLDLTPRQQEMAPLIVRKHLVLLEGNAPVSDEDRKQLTVGDAKVA